MLLEQQEEEKDLEDFQEEVSNSSGGFTTWERREDSPPLKRKTQQIEDKSFLEHGKKQEELEESILQEQMWKQLKEDILLLPQEFLVQETPDYSKIY